MHDIYSWHTCNMYVCTPGCVNSSTGCTGGLLNALVCTETSLTSLKDTRGGVSFSMKMYKKVVLFLLHILCISAWLYMFKSPQRKYTSFGYKTKLTS